MAEPLPTRLMLTNLPPSLTTPLLRAHLNRCPPYPPNLTDLKILLKPDGSSRRIAFVGFKENKEANRVREWVNGTWVQGTGGGANVKVDWALETKDAPPPRKRTKQAAEPPTPSSSKTPAGGNKDEASRFAEFMSVMGPRKGTALEDVSRMPESIVPIAKQQSKAAIAKGKEVQKQQEAEEEVLNVIEVEKDVVDDEAISDLEYMTRRMKRSLDEVDNEDEDEDIEHEGEGIIESGSKEWVQDEDGLKREVTVPVAEDLEEKAKEHAKAMILDSSRLFIRNLAFTITDQDLRTLLEPYGEIEQIHIPLDETKNPKGLAYATFTIAASAVDAYEALDRHSFQGRLLHIMPAIGRNSGEVAPHDRRTEGVKGARDELKKKDAGKGLNWGTLYMNSDAVMSSVAARLQISKADLLDPSADNAAVRVALAESHVIAETKKYFEEEGVNLAAFTTSGPRSNTTMLLKNIPYNTSSATLTALFSPFGTISRLLLPPAGTIAIVEMTDAPSASDAWRGLVYKKIGGSVLYLEKAPKELFNGPPVARPATSTASASVGTSKAAVVEETPSEAGATLFIKNLNFSTTSAILSTFFSNFDNFVFAKVQTKPDPKIPGGTLSMGFGFVGFKTVQAAMEAKKVREGALLESHLLEIKFAQRGKESEKEESGRGKGEKKKDNGTSTKLIVKNVPFEVTRKEIRELFSAYGQLKSVRLPKKMDQKTRGFAFLDFASRRDAESAFAALEHTHLLGRHLVLQWAEQGEEEVEQLRKRLGNFSNKKIGNKKGKFEMGGNKGDADMGGDLGGDLE